MSCMLNEKVMIFYLIVGLRKKILYKMSQCFPKPYEPSGGDINIKADLKNATGIDTSGFALKLNLASFKAEVDKIDIEKLKNVSTTLI